MGGWGSISFGKSSSKSSSQSTSNQDVFLADLFSKLYGGASGVAGGIDTSGLTTAANSLFSSGTGFISDLGAIGGGDALDASIGALSESLGKFYSEKLLPGITSDAASVGQFGGQRQGVAQGVAAGEVATAFSQGAADIYGQDVQNRIAAAQTGIGGLTDLYGIANNAALGPLSPYLALAQIMGDPTVLTQQQGTSKGKSSSWNFATAGGGGMGGGG